MKVWGCLERHRRELSGIASVFLVNCDKARLTADYFRKMTVLFQIYDMTTRRSCVRHYRSAYFSIFGHPVFKDGDADNTSLSFSKSICRVNATPARSGSLFFNSIPAFKQARFTSARGLYSLLGIVKLSRS